MTLRRRGVIPLVAAVVWAVLSAAAAAHGVLERADPVPGTRRDAPPGQIVLWFSEPVDPSLSAVVVRDRNGALVSGRLDFSEGDRRVTVPLTAASPGAYAVSWRIVSTLDGHLTAGSFLFSVGEPLPPGAMSRTAPPDAGQVLVRWIGYLAVLFVAGATVFRACVLRPALRGMDLPDAARVERIAASRLQAANAAAGTALLISLVVETAMRVAVVRDLPPGALTPPGPIWLLIGGTRSGWTIPLRLALVVLLVLPPGPRARLMQAAAVIWLGAVGLLIAVVGGPPPVGSVHFLYVVLPSIVYGMAAMLAALILPEVPDARLPDLPWAPPALAALLALAYAMASHAAGRGPVAVAADAVHVLAAAGWLGGLAACLLVLWAEAPERRVKTARDLMPRLHVLAAASLAILVVTGAYGAWLHVPTVRALVATPYGRTLLIKLLLVVLLLVLGARRRPGVGRRLPVSSGGVVHGVPSPRSYIPEAVLAVMILLAVAALTITPPR